MHNARPRMYSEFNVSLLRWDQGVFSGILAAALTASIILRTTHVMTAPDALRNPYRVEIQDRGHFALRLVAVGPILTRPRSRRRFSGNFFVRHFRNIQ